MECRSSLKYSTSSFKCITLFTLSVEKDGPYSSILFGTKYIAIFWHRQDYFV